jgi:hypothetical protein
MTDRPRNIANDILDAVETATSKWTRQKKSEERHPGNIRYRVSRMTREPRTTQKDAAWQIMEEAYMAASGNGSLPAMARQIYYRARETGLIWLLQGRDVAALTEETSAIRWPSGSVTVYRKSNKPVLGLLGDSLDGLI